MIEYRKDTLTENPAPPEARFVACMLIALVAVNGTAVAQSDDRSPFIDSISVGSVWQNVTASEGNNLRIDFEAIAYSGGGTGNGRTVVFGGGHNNGMTDAVAFLDWRNFETVGWTEELPSTADHIGVADNDYGAIGRHLNANYNGSTPGGISDSRGLVALSRHSYDQIVVGSDHFYLFSGILPYDNPGQPAEPWNHVEGDIWRYDFGVGWTFIGAPLSRTSGHAAAALDTLTGNIWVHDYTGLRLFNTSTGTTSGSRDYLNSQQEESSLNFNPDKGAQGTRFGSGRYAGSNWHEYDIATGQERNMGPVPGSSSSTYIIYVDDSFGPNYGTYFAIVPQNGTLRRWNGSGWDTIATGGPGGGQVYGRAGFESVHQVFYWVNNSYSGNNSWRTYVVRPYPFDGSVEPAPSVSLNANPQTVPPQGMTTLTWNATNATGCTASGDWNGAKPVSGSEMMGPLNSNRSYSLTCSGNGGTSADTVNVTVQTGQPAPTVDLSANPSVVDEGGFTVVGWTTANADTCTAFGDWTGQKATQGSESMGPLDENAQFTLTCTGPGGEETDSVAVTVNATQPPPPGNDDPDDNNSDKEKGTGTFGLPVLLLMSLVAVIRRRTIRTGWPTGRRAGI